MTDPRPEPLPWSDPWMRDIDSVLAWYIDNEERKP